MTATKVGMIYALLSAALFGVSMPSALGTFWGLAVKSSEKQ
jgi:hypothetical protein